jgi:3-dehydroquinate dehydratase-2
LKIIVVHGPNLNTLGKREPSIYGYQTLAGIDQALRDKGAELGCEVVTFQSNSEGALIDFIQTQSELGFDGLVINPGALTHYGLSLRDCLAALAVPIFEVHISNIYAREPWRARSVIAPVATGHMAGLGWHGYVLALQAMIERLASPKSTG